MELPNEIMQFALKNQNKEPKKKRIQIMYFALSAKEKRIFDRRGSLGRRYNPKRDLTYDKWYKNQCIKSEPKTLHLEV